SNFIGTYAGLFATDASYSNFIGYNAGNTAVSASNSIFIGQGAGGGDSVDNTADPDDFSILIGKSTSTGGFSNSIALGGSATNTAANQLMIGSATRPILDTRIIGTTGTVRLDIGKDNENFLSTRYDTVTGTSYIYSYFNNAVSSLILQANGGNVGIGTATPNSSLEVVGASKLVTDGGRPNVNIFTSDAYAADLGGSLGLGGKYNAVSTSYTNFATIVGRKENSTLNNVAGYFAILTRANSDPLERMRVTSEGNVGIGTTTPNINGNVSTTLTIQGSSTNRGSLELATTTGVANGTIGQITFHNGGTLTNIISATTDSVNADSGLLKFFTKPTAGSIAERMRIETNGNVGIGTTNPSTIRLYVETNAAAYGQYIYNPHASGNGLGIQAALDSTHYALNVVTGNNNPLFMVRGDGRVGIGTTNPYTKLHVAGAALITNEGNVAGDVTGTLNIGGFVSGSTLYYSNAIKSINTASTPGVLNARMGFFTLGGTAENTAHEVERLSILAGSGYVGIGTASPLAKLVVSNGGANGLEFNPVNGGTGGTSSDILSYNRNTAQYTSLRVLGSEMLFGTSGVTNGIFLANNGEVGIGTATTSGYKLNIEHAASLAVRIRSTGGTDNAYLQFTNLQGNANIGLNGGVGQLLTNSVDGAFAISNITGAPIHISADTGQYANEGVTILENGNVGIGTTSPDVRLTIEADAAGNLQSWKRSGANADMFMGGVTGPSTQLNIRANGSGGVYLAAGGTSWTASSDERLKDMEAFQPFTDALGKISSLRAGTSRYLTDPLSVSRSFLIAQDVRRVLPEAVTENAQGYMGVSYTDIIPLLVAGVKDLDIKVQALPEFEDDGSMAAKVAAFLEGIAEGIANIGRVNTDKLCVGQTCVTESQLQELLDSANGSYNNTTNTPDPTPEPQPDPEPEPEPTPQEDGPSEEPTPEPEPTPDPTPEPQPEPEPTPEPEAPASEPVTEATP
ncbi:MAG TPA: tail fiber domain-containing protein, partial [Candidatus Paceibacterota bacterium]